MDGAATARGPWTAKDTRALLALPFAKRQPTRTISALLADPQLGPWVQRRGGLAAVQAYLRTFPLPPKQRAMLEAFLERPGDTLAAYIERLDIPETTFQRYLKALLAALTDHLNAWERAPNSADHPESAPAPHAHALPATTTRLVGRAQELAELCRLLGESEVRLAARPSRRACGPPAGSGPGR